MKIIGIQKIQSESFFNAEVTALNTLTVGVDGTGHDAKFFGDTSGQFLLWDQSSDELVLAGDTKLSFHDAAGGENIIASADGHLEINAGTTLDITATTIDINGAADVSGNFTLAGTAIATVIAGTTVTNATNSAHVLVTDNESANEENLIAFVEGATSSTGNVGLEMDGDLTYNPSGGKVSAKQFEAAQGFTMSKLGAASAPTAVSNKAIIFMDSNGNLQVTLHNGSSSVTRQLASFSGE